MTAAPPVDRAAASRLVAALEQAWTAIRSLHPEVPQVVIVVASGSDPRSRRLNLGHFAAGRWQLTSPDQPGDRAEVLVSGEGLQRGPVDVLGTLLHEAAHGLAHVRKLSDTSRQGRYHNRLGGCAWSSGRSDPTTARRDALVAIRRPARRAVGVAVRAGCDLIGARRWSRHSRVRRLGWPMGSPPMRGGRRFG
jgi:hypothetical protein